ncbi:hypothetical protein [uncultured Ruegeria sp.]|nr:hypothetical protein [uncultured Ruegeria sp.]
MYTRFPFTMAQPFRVALAPAATTLSSVQPFPTPIFELKEKRP